ncbi:MAG: Response regulator [Myxococcaceae bacterium]|nr:Response regulator [Myxococcaceae bacterium]
MTVASVLPRVLIVDDDPLRLELVHRGLSFAGFEVSTLGSPIGATSALRNFAPDIVLIDVDIPGLPGDRLMGLLRRYAPSKTRFLLFSSCDGPTLERLAIEVRAHGWLSKGESVAEISRRLRELHRAPPPSRRGEM